MSRRLLLGLVFAALFALACSSSPDSTPTAASRTEAPTAPITQATPLVATPGKLVRLYVDPPTLDPHRATDATSAAIIVEVFGGLVTLNPELKVVPDLAEKWDVSADGRVYAFHLRDAKFHDGRQVTAEDFRWSLERAADPTTEAPSVDQYLGDIVGAKAKIRGEAKTISGVKVINDKTLEISIDAAKPYFLAKLTYPTAFVLDRANVEKNPRTWSRKPNATGPFKLSEYRVGETLRLTRNENYHLGAPKLNEVEFILSGGTAMLMYENNEISLTGVGIADLDRLLNPNNHLNKELHRAPPSFSVQYLGMNVKEPPLDDIKVRQALNLAVDKKEIASVVLANQVVPAKAIIPPGFPSYNEFLQGYDYNPEKAKQLLKESKYGSNLDNLPHITLTTAGQFGAAVNLDLDVILQMWEKNLGIKVDVQQTEFATYLRDLHRRRFQMFQIGWIADYPDPENFLDILFHSTSSNNHTNYRNLEVDRLLEQARTENDQSARFQLYNRIEQMIMNDAPWLPLWYSGEQYLLIKPEVKDYFLTPLVIPKLRYVYFGE